MKFSITIPCKPYTKRFLEIKYGSPVDFTRDKTIYPLFRQKLQRQSTRHDNTYAAYKLDKYSTTAELKITEDDFYTLGWELTTTEIVKFNKEMEGRAKLFMYMFVATRITFGMNVTDAVRCFQERFEFTEDVWQSESIVKDCQRNLTVHRGEVIENISELLDKIVLEKMSEKGTTFHRNKSLKNIAS